MNYKKGYIIFLFFISILLVIFSLNIYFSNQESIVNVKSVNKHFTKKGLGIVYKKNKYVYIVTNHHIISDSEKIYIKYSNKQVKAELIDSDEYEDIAILKIRNDRKLKKAKFSYKYKQKDVVHINNYNSGKIKNGTIKKTNELVPVKLIDGNYLIKAIKIQMNIEEGNSGGPLYNKRGKIIGMVCMQDIEDNSISYVLDINQVLGIAKKLENGKIERPDLGVEVATSTNTEILNKYGLNNYELSGVIVTNVFNSEKLKKGDIITSINNNQINDVVHFKYYLYNSSNKIIMTIYRDGKYINIST